MNISIKYLCEEYLQCPRCRGGLRYGAVLRCKKCSIEYPIDGRTVRFIANEPDDVVFSIKKWDEGYARDYISKSYLSSFNQYKSIHFEKVSNQILSAVKDLGSVYLEIGCGPMFMGNLLNKKFDLIIGIDFCPSALKTAKELLDSAGVKNYLLIQGNILNMPLKDNCVNLIYGGGVLEHFDNTCLAVSELARVLCRGGVSFNTVPMLNIGSLTYRQLWGNIPKVRFVSSVLYFLHKTLLGGKHMVYGLEYSFLPSMMRDYHLKSGFRKVIVDRFDVTLEFHYLPKLIKSFMIWIATKSFLFWPMIKVIGYK